MVNLDKDQRIQLAGEAAKLTGIHIPHDDVAFVLLALNHLILKNQAKEVAQMFHELPSQIRWELAGVSVDLEKARECSAQLLAASNNLTKRTLQIEDNQKKVLENHANRLVHSISDEINGVVTEVVKQVIQKPLADAVKSISVVACNIDHALEKVRLHWVWAVGGVLLASLISAWIVLLFAPGGNSCTAPVVPPVQLQETK